jgi:uncharacterized protein (DUF2249 family)
MNTEREEIPADKIFKAQDIPCAIRHRLILGVWDHLKVNDYFVLQNDHDPVPLLAQFRKAFPDSFSWEYVSRRPGEFQIKITRLRKTAAGFRW